VRELRLAQIKALTAVSALQGAAAWAQGFVVNPERSEGSVEQSLCCARRVAPVANYAWLLR